MFDQTLRPPRPTPPERELPLLRYIWTFRHNGVLAWPRAAYEADVRERRMFGRKIVLLNAPADIRHVLVDNNAAYGRTRATIRIVRPIVGRGLLLSEGDEWRHQRRTLAPAFAPRALGMLARHVAIVADETVQRLDRQQGKPVDLMAEVQGVALEVAGRSMFSLEMVTFGGAMRSMLERYGETLARPRMLDFLVPIGVPTPHDLLRRRFERRWFKLIERLMAARHDVAPTDNDGPRDLFDLLRAARDPETAAPFSAVQLRDQVSTMITAGHETTALAMFWVLYLLAQAPETQQAMADEAAGVDLSPDRAADAIDALPLTRAVVQEALRLYPPAWVLARAAREADTVAGLTLAPEDVVLVSPWVLHRHRKLWDDPDRFDPARFGPGAVAADRFAYLPFGAGPRICIGAQFAMNEATLVLARLVGAYEISLMDREPVMPVGIITLLPDRRPPFALKRRRPRTVPAQRAA